MTPGVTIGPIPGPHCGKTVVMLLCISKAVTVVVGIQVVVTTPSLLVRIIVPSVEIADQYQTTPSAAVHRDTPLGSVRDILGIAVEFTMVAMGAVDREELIGPVAESMVLLVVDVPIGGPFATPDGRLGDIVAAFESIDAEDAEATAIVELTPAEPVLA